MNLETDHDTPASNCPFCATVINVAAGDCEPPRQDDYAVCFHCGGISVFGEDLILRALTQKEADDVDMDVIEMAVAARLRLRLQELH